MFQSNKTEFNAHLNVFLSLLLEDSLAKLNIYILKSHNKFHIIQM